MELSNDERDAIVAIRLRQAKETYSEVGLLIKNTVIKHVHIRV